MLLLQQLQLSHCYLNPFSEHIYGTRACLIPTLCLVRVCVAPSRWVGSISGLNAHVLVTYIACVKAHPHVYTKYQSLYFYLGTHSTTKYVHFLHSDRLHNLARNEMRTLHGRVHDPSKTETCIRTNQPRRSTTTTTTTYTQLAAAGRKTINSCRLCHELCC